MPAVAAKFNYFISVTKRPLASEPEQERRKKPIKVAPVIKNIYHVRGLVISWKNQYKKNHKEKKKMQHLDMLHPKLCFRPLIIQLF
ncbi:MAG: hypothetical protein PHW56_07835 [Methanosarcinaceae archaeon]|nr:hypothetical protein [Methanosarcinaceae archaeon]